ncbi:MAG: hypothetical protein HETSPECPRED_008921 [Heterodermia speciosa]|uniref:Uncharacterized protein n=1 Tax=Heterodermia speciosa TaxID=116794 RepID=A0A8H3EUU3_9LECA|nr:MAG: hypothetical protein HETSPECPRED_008921 [Heterodermia speciosa]
MATHPASPRLDSEDGLDDLLAEAIWYDDYQRAFSDTLRAAVDTTGNEITRASRRLMAAKQVQRDAKVILQARKGHEADGNAIQKVLEGLNKAGNEVKELEALSSLLEKRLGWEIRLSNEVSGE